MKSLIFLSLGLLYLSNVDSTDLHSAINPIKSAQCGIALQYLSQSQLQTIQEIQIRLKEQEALAQQNQVLLAQTARALKNPEVLANVQEKPEQASQILTKAIQDRLDDQRRRAALAQIRENYPAEESTEDY